MSVMAEEYGARRIFTPEKTINVGGSYLLPPWVLVCTRLISALVTLGIGVTCVVLSRALRGPLQPYAWLYMLPGSTLILQAAAFGVLCGGSVASTRHCEDHIAMWLGSLLHQCSSTLAMFLAIVSAAHSACAKEDHFSLTRVFILNPFLWSTYNVGMALSMIDFTLGARIIFRAEYIPLPIITLVIFTVIVHRTERVQFPEALQFIHGSDYIAWLLGFHILCGICALLMMVVSRLNYLIDKSRKTDIDNPSKHISSSFV